MTSRSPSPSTSAIVVDVTRCSLEGSLGSGGFNSAGKVGVSDCLVNTLLAGGGESGSYSYSLPLVKMTTLSGVFGGEPGGGGDLVTEIGPVCSGVSISGTVGLASQPARQLSVEVKVSLMTISKGPHISFGDRGGGGGRGDGGGGGGCRGGGDGGEGAGEGESGGTRQTHPPL